MENKKTKQIFFDLGGVLVKFDAQKAVTSLAKRTTVAASEIFKIACDAHHELAHEFEKGLISGEIFYEKVRTALNLELALEDFKQIYVDIFTENRPVIQLLEKLESRYPVHMISNTTSWHFEFIRNSYDWMNRFTCFITSFNVHLLKPDRRIFLHALTMAGALPESAVFIDDALENVMAATDVGMLAIHYQNDRQLWSEIEKLNLWN